LGQRAFYTPSEGHDDDCCCKRSQRRTGRLASRKFEFALISAGPTSVYTRLRRIERREMHGAREREKGTRWGEERSVGISTLH
jgi:hypothetical protein